MRTTTRTGITLAIAATLTLGAAYVAQSGQLDPPDGPIAPTGASLNDIFQSVNAQGVNPKAVNPGMAGFPSSVAQMTMFSGNDDIPRSIIDAGPINVYGFSHSVRAPRDAASGLPTGRRQHKPFTITKPIDKSTPLLMNALVRSDVIDEISIHLGSYARGIDVPEPITYRLIGARIASVEPFTRGINPGGVVFMEQVEIVYDHIIVTWENGGITAEDDWESPQVD